MLHLGGANALGQRTERPVGGGVGVPADNGHPRLGGALLRPHDVNDALAHIQHAKLPHPVPTAVVVKNHHLLPGHRVGDAVNARSPVVRRHIVVRRGQIGLFAPKFPACLRQAREGLGRGDLMQQLQVDVEQALPILPLADQVIRPNFVVQRWHPLAPSRLA